MFFVVFTFWTHPIFTSVSCEHNATNGGGARGEALEASTGPRSLHWNSASCCTVAVDASSLQRASPVVVGENSGLLYKPLVSAWFHPNDNAFSFWCLQQKQLLEDSAVSWERRSVSACWCHGAKGSKWSGTAVTGSVVRKQGFFS